MGAVKFERSQLVDLAIIGPYGGSSINFPDQPMLRFMRITGISTYSISDMPYSPITGNPLPTTANLQNAALVLYMGDPQNEKDTGEFVFQMPLIDLHNIQNGVDPFRQIPFEFDDVLVQWEKNQVVFAELPSAIGFATFSYVFNILYTSRGGRLTKMMLKKVGAVAEGSMLDMLIMKIMQLEEKLKRLSSKR